jgi:hypothetical protein
LTASCAGIKNFNPPPIFQYFLINSFPHLMLESGPACCIVGVLISFGVAFQAAPEAGLPGAVMKFSNAWKILSGFPVGQESTIII